MTVLSETRRLLMEPGSNLPAEHDDSWLHLLPATGRVAILGEPNERIRRLIENRYGADFVTDLVSGTEAELVVVATSSVELVSDHLDSIESASIVVHLPGAATPALGRSWLILEPRLRRSRWISRARKALRLVQTRLLNAVTGSPSSIARRHASDVAFVEVPADLRDGPAKDVMGIGRDSFPVPAPLREIVEAQGVGVHVGRWSYGPPRGFASQKVVFRLRTHDDSSGIVVKLTQDPRFNERLAAEGDALERLGAIGFESLAFPEVLFRDRVGDLLVLGQTELVGFPFRRISDGNPDGAPARMAASAIVELGMRTAVEQPASAVPRALSALVSEFEGIYRPPTAVTDRLRSTVESLATLDIPSVSMHGDFGVWNLMMLKPERLGVLDWENADAEGVPLWDLFVFARTLGVLAADLAGQRYVSRRFIDQFSEPAPLRRALASWVEEYCDSVGVPRSAVQGLFQMCWVQQAVREAASLASPKWLESQGTRIVNAAFDVGGFGD